MTALLTIFLTLVIVALLFALFVWVKRPYYRVDRQQMIKVLEMALTGQATENNWQMVFGMTIRHSDELEDIRQQACAIEESYALHSSSRVAKSGYLFSAKGLAELEELLQILKNKMEP